MYFVVSHTYLSDGDNYDKNNKQTKKEHNISTRCDEYFQCKSSSNYYTAIVDCMRVHQHVRIYAVYITLTDVCCPTADVRAHPVVRKPHNMLSAVKRPLPLPLLPARKKSFLSRQVTRETLWMYLFLIFK